MVEGPKTTAPDNIPDLDPDRLKVAPNSRFKDLGVTPYARQLGLASDQTHGHWCKRCQGIWFGYSLEVECPSCGNRSG